MNESAWRSALRRLIEDNPDLVNFGSASQARDEQWIGRAEAVLERPLPESYKWFLRNCVGGEIGGDEIYSIYGKEFSSAVGGDIVFQYLNGLKQGLLDESKIVVSETDWGEVFFFDTTRSVAGEYPVCLRLPSEEIVDYATNFYEFLIKRIEAHLRSSDE